MTTKYYYLPIEQKLISNAFSERRRTNVITQPKAYVEWYDENDTLYLLTTCISFTVSYQEGEIVSDFSLVCAGAHTVNPRTADYSELLTADLRKEVRIYYGEYDSDTGSYTYTRIFTGIPTDVRESYKFGEATISVSGKSLPYKLAKIDLVPYTTIGYAKIEYSNVTSDDDFAVGSNVYQNGTDGTGIVYQHNTTDDYIILRNVEGTFSAYGGSCYVVGDNTQRIDAPFTITEGTDTISGPSKDIIKWICGLGGISYSLTYTDTIELDEDTFTFDTGLAAINGLKEVLGPNVEMYVDSSGTLVMKDVPEWNSNLTEFEYDANNMLRFERYVDSSQIVTQIRIVGKSYVKITYFTIYGVLTLGDPMKQWNTLAEGTLHEHEQVGDPDYIVLRNTKGDFDDVNAVDVDDANWGTGSAIRIEPLDEGVSTIEIESGRDADNDMILKYGEVKKSISSGFINNQTQADNLCNDLLYHSRRFFNIAEVTAVLNPQLTCGSLITITDQTLSNTSETNVRIKGMTHSFKYGSSNTTSFEGYMGESLSSSSSSRSSSSSSSSESSSSSSRSSSSSSRSSSSSSSSSAAP